MGMVVVLLRMPQLSAQDPILGPRLAQLCCAYACGDSAQHGQHAAVLRNGNSLQAAAGRSRVGGRVAGAARSRHGPVPAVLLTLWLRLRHFGGLAPLRRRPFSGCAWLLCAAFLYLNRASPLRARGG